MQEAAECDLHGLDQIASQQVNSRSVGSPITRQVRKWFCWWCEDALYHDDIKKVPTAQP
jgi:hypothetical protein